MATVVLKETMPKERPTSPTNSKKQADWTDVQSLLEQEHLKKQGFIGRVRKWRGWLSFLTLAFLGSVILVAPGVYLYVFHPFSATPYPNPFITGVPVSVLVGAEFQVSRWSFWLTCVWLIYVISSFLLDALPALVVTAISFFAGSCSQHVRQKLTLIPVLKPWIHQTSSLIFSVVTFRVFFLQVDEVPEWKQFYNILISVMIASIVFTFQRIFVQNTAENFHKIAYEDRIVQSQRAIFMLENLRKAIRGFGLARVFGGNDGENESLEVPEPVKDDHEDSPKGPPKRDSFLGFLKPKKVRKARSDPNVVSHQSVIEIDRPSTPREPKLTSYGQDQSAALQPPGGATLTRRNTKTSSASKVPKSPLPQQHTTLNIGSKNKRKTAFTFDLYSDENAEDLANELFRALETRERSEVELKSFYEHFESAKDAKEAFDMFDRNGSGSVDLNEMVWACKRIYREKKSLSESLGDVSQALGNLNKILYFFSGIIILIFCAPLYNISFQTIVPFTSILLALSFVFGGSARNTFECIIFLFVYHPYDVGDRIFFDGKNYIVKELSILQTTFTSDGKQIYVANGKLF